MNLKDFNTLEEAQAHTETVTRFISASTMRIYLKTVGLYLPLVDMSEDVDSPARELALMVIESLKSPNSDGKDFNFIKGTTFGKGNLLELENMKSLVPSMTEQIDQLKTIVTNHCNVVTYPYANVTQEEFDADKATGETEATSVLYEGQDVVHLVTAGKKLLKFVVTLDEPAAHDSTVTISATGKQTTDETVYLPLSRTFTVNVKAGQQGAFSLDQAIAYFPRHVQFTATIDKANTLFTLDVVTS